MARHYLRAALCFTAVTGIAACGPSAEKQAEDIAAHDLTDPASAQFREVKPLDGTECYQGEINAKNRMGGYVGFRPFIVDFKKKEVAIVPADDDGLDATLAKARIEVFKQDCGLKN